MTRYLVFKQKDEPTEAAGSSWVQVGEADAGGPREAISKVLSSENGSFERNGVFVASPKRSWKPLTVAPKQAFTFS